MSAWARVYEGCSGKVLGKALGQILQVVRNSNPNECGDGRASHHPALKMECYFHLAKIRLYSDSAALRASPGDSSPCATLANIVGMIQGLERLVDGRGSVAGIADIGGPIENIAQNFVLVCRICPRVIRDLLLQVGHKTREAREVVELPSLESIMEMLHVVHQELLCALFVLRELPDDVAVHQVLGGDAAYRRCSRSDCRVIEMAFITNETRPASMAWLLEGRGPSKYLRRFALLVECAHVLESFDGVLGIDGHIAGFVLLRSAERP